MPESLNSPGARRWVLVAATIAIAAAIFATDCLTPRGLAVPVLYIIPLLLAFQAGGTAAMFAVTVAVTLLAVLGYFLKPTLGHEFDQFAIFNRMMSLTAVWATAAGLWFFRRLQKRLEDAQASLVEQKALAHLGEMVTVVAHEVRNPLAGIGGAIQIIGGRLPEDSRDRAVIGEIMDRLASLNDTVNHLLVYGRPRPPSFRRIGLLPLLNDSGALLDRDPACGGVSVRVSGDDVRLNADPDLLREAVMNLLLNAAQAMKGQGSIAIGVARSGAAAEITIRDTGPGIPPEARERIFDPFFTTKSRGTGLGLPITRRAVLLHGGTISADCPPGGGTVFRIVLPVG
ncbi:MAG: hypothetical protein KIT79_06810 [Deltaproteobacteria bacterium]|nr:hypothetical protein [Deltaproteobacteria bacterium]